MAKKVVSLTEKEAAVLRFAICDGPGWADPPGAPPKNQWRQMRWIERFEELEPSSVEIETTSADRRAMIAALDNVVSTLKGRAARPIWDAKLALGWKAPDLEDLDDDEETE